MGEENQPAVLADTPPITDKAVKMKALMQQGMTQLTDAEGKMNDALVKAQQQLTQINKNLTGIAAQKALLVELLNKIDE